MATYRVVKVSSKRSCTSHFLLAFSAMMGVDPHSMFKMLREKRRENCE